MTTELLRHHVGTMAATTGRTRSIVAPALAVLRAELARREATA